MKSRPDASANVGAAHRHGTSLTLAEMPNPIAYYNLEKFLLTDVREHFLRDGSLGAFDLFSIIIWKSNRSKSKVARRLLAKSSNRNLEQISRNISAAIARAKSDKEKMRVLITEGGFKLAIASAILTILYPDEFTIYDYRTAAQIDEGAKLKTKTNFDDIWDGYALFRSKVAAIRCGDNLREKDHYLFGKSRMEDLIEDIGTGFTREDETKAKPVRMRRREHRA